MVDDLTPQQPMPESEGAAPKKGLAGFVSTTVGKIILAVAALAVLGVVALIVVSIVLPVVFGTLGGNKNAATTPPASTKPSTTTTAAADAPVVPKPASNADVFTFRDIFEPLIAPEPSATESGTAGAGEADTLYLQDIVTENGTRKAVLLWNGTTYTLGTGERIPDTPWQVVSVGSESVSMLYGDSEITLFVGQGFASK